MFADLLTKALDLLKLTMLRALVRLARHDRSQPKRNVSMIILTLELWLIDFRKVYIDSAAD